jgi:hypothetical protein
MSDAQKFERDYLVSVIDGNLFWYTKAQFPFRNPAWYVNQLARTSISRAHMPRFASGCAATSDMRRQFQL